MTILVPTVASDDMVAIFHGVVPNGINLFAILTSSEYNGYPGGWEMLHVLATSENSALSPPNIKLD